ncbi:dihydropteroate synthase [Propionibacterium cyclohexanicum]
MSHTRVMGIVNVTPDSFSDGGLYMTPDRAIAHALAMVRQGAEILDVGGESTRPGARRVAESEELHRVLPVIKGLRARRELDAVPVSIDTVRARVARAAVGAGATIVNDVSGGLVDAQMFGTVARLGVDYVCQHWRGFGADMTERARYGDVVGEVHEELAERVAAARRAGIPAERIIVDPGLGFAKLGEQDWQLLGHLDVFTSMGHRLLIGASRKRFLGHLLGGREARERDAATAAVSMWCALHGVWAVRTHEVSAQVDAVAVAEHLTAIAAPNPLPGAGLAEKSRCRGSVRRRFG